MFDIVLAAEKTAEAARSAQGTGSVLGTLGINLKLFIAQLINFTIILLVLWRFAWKPILRILNERKAYIETGIENAKKAEADLQMAELNYKKRMNEAEDEAGQILKAAEGRAGTLIEGAKTKAKHEIEAMTAKAKRELKAEKETLELEIKEKTVEIAFEVAAKILDEKMDIKKEKKFVEALLK